MDAITQLKKKMLRIRAAVLWFFAGAVRRAAGYAALPAAEPAHCMVTQCETAAEPQPILDIFPVEVWLHIFWFLPWRERHNVYLLIKDLSTPASYWGDVPPSALICWASIMVAYDFPFPELTKWSAKYAVKKEKIMAELRRECEKKYPLSEDERFNPYPEHKQTLMFAMNMRKLRQAMECACIQNRRAHVEWITEKFGASLCPVRHYVAEYHHYSDVLRTVWEKGYLEMMQLIASPEDIREKGTDLLLFACERNRFEQARWLVTNPCIAGIDRLQAILAMGYVMERCNVKMAELVWPSFSMHFDADIALTLVERACLSGNTGMIEWLLSRAPWKQEISAAFEAADYEALYVACDHGHPETAQWLVDCFSLSPTSGLRSILHLNEMRALYLSDVDRPNSRLHRWFSKAILKKNTSAKKHCANAEQFARALADWLSIPGAETMPFIELLRCIIAASDNKKKFETRAAMFASIRWA